jgi:predicted DNA-binding transcriptional regulator YafY
MARGSSRKIKLIKLLELLRQRTDEDHPLSTNQICAILGEMDVPCDRRTLTGDVAALNELGYEIMTTTQGHEKAYYVEDRNFSVPELKILMDAVQAASFITEKKTAELTEKLAALAGEHRAELLKRNMVSFNTRKHSNEKILYTIDRLEEAILKQKKVIFLYFDLDEKGKRVYRRDGHHYVVEPVALVLNEDDYYLSCYSSRHGSTSNYRVDRMDAVEVIQESCTESAIALREQVAAYTGQAFKMFGGQESDLVLEFPRWLIGAVYDRFGESTPMMASGQERCIATVKVRVSPVFWGWLFQFAGEMQLLSPADLVEEYKALARKILG